jgi:hypothetical protein
VSDCEMPEAYVGREVVARKPHRCCECRGWILRGERHQVISGIWDGTPARFRTCADCVHIRCSARDADWYGECIAFGDLRDNLSPPLAGAFDAVAAVRRERTP